ncbi:MAG: TonB-dependent receptor plug domain-containing protein [Thermoanaerobaculia bacterium]
MDAILPSSVRLPGAFFAICVGFFLAASAGAQVPPVSENVVVSGSLAPETEPNVSSSVTVISRAQIEKSGKTDVLELLREVPGVDVVESGDAGKVTSVFLRGTNSTQTLVLIDGVRVNSPYFSGYDFSALSTQNIERIEVVRGPFSALYGSDAIGGVISILRREPSAEPSARASVAAGNRSSHEETLFASARAGSFGFTLSGRDAHDAGEAQTVGGTRVDNDGWSDRNGSAAVQWAPSPAIHAGLEVERMFARSEIPSDSGVATPRRFTDFAQTTWTLPVRAAISESNSFFGSLSDVELRPTAVDPDDSSGFFQSETHSRILGARAADTWKSSESNALSGSASYERSTVDSSGAFGPILQDRRTAIWGVGVEDSAAFLGGRLRAVAGVRFDRHSVFGPSTNPRVSFIGALGGGISIRASYGTAFRAPSIGELYYPFFGNPKLDPERSRSYEIGANRTVGAFQLDLAIFRNDIRDLIQYDPVRQTNANVGRAQTEGAEASASFPISGALQGRLSYTYLRAIDRETGEPLARRPRHRGSIDLVWSPGAWTASATALYVGTRPDFQSVFPFGTVQDPSYLRFDAFVRYRFENNVGPFLRLENLTDRRYSEASGFPAAGRRILGGLAVAFSP